MSQFFDATTGWPLASTQERDRSQMPLWPELESELELALAAQDPASVGAAAPAVPADSFAATDALPADVVIALPLVLAGNVDENPVSTIPATMVDTRALLPGEYRLDGRAEAFANADAELGQRLRAARERAEIPRDELVRRTRISLTLIQAIEDGRFERLGAAVFARGYLRSYARAVGLPDAVVGVWEGRVDRVLEVAPAPSLAATSPRRSSRQVASPIVYTLLTVLIAVPAYYGVRQAQQSPLLHSRPPAAAAESERRDASSPGNTTPASAASSRVPQDSRNTRQAVSAVPRESDAWRQPVMASLTPMLGSGSDAEVPPAPLDVRRLQVRLLGPSWVEIIASDGQVIERSLLPTGSMREYAVPRSARLRIGDAGVVELRADGKVLDLVPYTHANVATLTLDEAG